MTEQSPHADLTRRRFLAATGGLTAVTLLGACGGGQSAQEAGGGTGAEGGQEFDGSYDGPEITLAYWNGFTGGDGPAMEQMLQDFMAEHENIKIENNTVQWADFYQRVPAAVNAGQGPDVGVMHADQLATMAARNVIVPVDDLVAELQLSEEDFTPEVWRAGEYQGSRYGLPLDVHSLAMYYDTEKFQTAGLSEPPTDEESYLAALDQLKGSGNDTPFWMPSRWPAHLMFLTLLWQNGGEPYAEDGSAATFDSEEGVAALTWMVDMVKQGYSPPNVEQDAQYVAFKNRRVDITWDGIWQINDLDDAGMPYGIAPIPQIGDQPLVWANSHNFFMTRQASQDDNKSQASKVFLDWMSQQSVQWAQAGMIPARASVREEAGVTESTQAPVAEQIDNMRFLPPIPGVGGVQTETLEVAVAEAVLGNEEPAAALQAQARRATTLMEQNLEQFGG